MCNNASLDLVIVNAYAKFGQNTSLCSHDVEWKEILTSMKGHNSTINLWKLMCNNPNLDIDNINANVKFRWNLSKSACVCVCVCVWIRV